MDTAYKHKLEQAILVLENLLEVQEGVESAYQKFFEDYPIVFEVLGYRRAIPVTKGSEFTLPRDKYTNLKPEPDFLVERHDGLWEIFEIKTPIDDKLLIDSNSYRKRLKAVIQSYISQIEEYADYFKNPSNRQSIEEKLKVIIQEDVPIQLIIGKRDKTDLHELHRILMRSSKKPNIIFYDVLAGQLNSKHKNFYGFSEKTGITAIFYIRLLPPEKQEYCVFEIRSKSGKSGLNLLLFPPDRLSFNLIDINPSSAVARGTF